MSIAVFGMGLSRNSLWRDDIAQAALIRVWQSGDVDPAHVHRHARFAAIDEMRRIFGRGETVTFVDIAEAPETAHDDTPERILERMQALDAADRQLGSLGERDHGIAARVAAGHDYTRIALDHGISADRVCQIVAKALAVLAERR